MCSSDLFGANAMHSEDNAISKAGLGLDAVAGGAIDNLFVGRRDTWGLDAAWHRNLLDLSAEYIRANLRPTNRVPAGSFHAAGWHATAGYFVVPGALQAVVRREADHRIKMARVRVDATVAKQPHQVERAPRRRQGVPNGADQGRVAVERPVPDRRVDARQVLQDPKASAKVEVPHLGVPNLTLRQSHRLTGGVKSRCHPGLRKRIKMGRRDGGNRVPRPGRGDAPAIEDDQN